MYSTLDNTLSRVNTNDSLEITNGDSNYYSLNGLQTHSGGRFQLVIKVMKKYVTFLGPGIMVSVSFMDPGNYSTSVTASKFHFKLLCSIFVSNVMAIFLQALCAKLGCVTGMDLAQLCKKQFSRRTNLVLYTLTEIAIIATDLAEVVGTAISLNILLNLPLIAGVALTIVDVLLVLMAYRPNGPMFVVRLFEAFVSCFVLGTVICFAIELIAVSDRINLNELVLGYLPSKTIFTGDGLYISLAILGATVMPHSLYLGSGLVQPRLKEYDIKLGNHTSNSDQGNINDDEEYAPSIDAINETMTYTLTELIISLFTVALFVNSSILIIAAATLNDQNDTNISTDPDLFTIYYLLQKNLSKSAALVFAFALLFSGLSAGVVCTLAGQMVSEGFLDWKISPTLRRIITRSIAILPCFLLSFLSGREGLNSILNLSQVILCLLLPIVSAPLIIFTNSKHIMKVKVKDDAILLDTLNNYTEGNDDSDDIENVTPNNNDASQRNDVDRVVTKDSVVYIDMSNGPITKFFSIVIWVFISLLNLYLIFNLALGKDVPL